MCLHPPQEDGHLSAEAEVERRSGMKFYQGTKNVSGHCSSTTSTVIGTPGLPLATQGCKESGIVAFTLQQLPLGQHFHFEGKNHFTITRIGDGLYDINGLLPAELSCAQDQRADIAASTAQGKSFWERE